METNMKHCKLPGIPVVRIVPGSIADAKGIKRGDQLLSINGIRPRDLIEYRYLITEENVKLKIHQPDGQVAALEITKDCDTDLGIVFLEDCFDGIKRCHNKCVFCFIDQLPSSLRSSLYVKDDDYRLSFIHGNFITLTNLSEGEITRIMNLKLSPLYLSVHTTDPVLRGSMMGRKGPAPVLDLISCFAKKGITMHIQVVLCPGWNDGKVLERTIEDLAAFWPQVASVGVVPVGLTKFRQGLPILRGITMPESRKIINKVNSLQETFRQRNGVSFVYLGDEFYLKARQPFPSSESYDGFPQLENGIGMGRLFYDDFRKIRPSLPARLRQTRQLSIVTSRAGASVLLPVVRRLRLIKNLDLKLISIPNTFFGPRITVTGLITGQDLLWGLKSSKGEDVLVPRILLRRGTSLFLDGLTVAEVERRCKCSIHLLDTTAPALVECILKLGGDRL